MCVCGVSLCTGDQQHGAVFCTLHTSEDYVTPPDAGRAVLWSTAVPTVSGLLRLLAEESHLLADNRFLLLLEHQALQPHRVQLQSTSKALVNRQEAALHCLSEHDYAVEPPSVEEQQVAAQDRRAELERELSTARISRFGLEQFSASPTMIKLYRGFLTYNSLISFFRCIVLYVTAMVAWSQVQRGTSAYQHCFGARLQPVDLCFLFYISCMLDL